MISNLSHRPAQLYEAGISVKPQRKIRDKLAHQGYTHVNSDFLNRDAGSDLAEARSSFLRTIRKNPVDMHSNGNRYRRYSAFVLHPWSGVLESLPTVWDAEQNKKVARYLQSDRINPEHGGKARGFAPLTPAQRTNLFIRSTILRCFAALPWVHHERPVIVGVHVIQLIASKDNPAVSSPDALHRDGEPYTWAFLLERHGILGGENIIAIPEVANQHPSHVADGDILDRFTLETPFDGWVVDDKKVSHYVSPVSVEENHEKGWRTILLIDFTPAVPDIER